MKHRTRDLLLAGIALVGLSACDPLGLADKAEEAAAETANLAGDATGTSAVAAAATPDFGDDNGRFAKDGECDDMRFEGAGMTSTVLLDEDIRHDASDCRSAFEQGRLTFKGDNVTAASLRPPVAEVNRVQWGDDNGAFANDGECDDSRFQGAGMTSTPLLDTDIRHDATDCRTAFEQGRLSLR